MNIEHIDSHWSIFTHKEPSQRNISIKRDENLQQKQKNEPTNSFKNLHGIVCIDPVQTWKLVVLKSFI